ncbi:hypothetical protein PF007_g21076 [Phytophthora fragariae]|uniref:Uncharacterized protein n=1 Tax=Phytophthora fragariae TaxID=53985 RepID=A0A6A3QXH3_9STRA|nr:hypothetical protein PF007_g21076 [Phytophthora fragariae]
MRGVSNLLAASGTTRLPRSVRSRAKRTEQAVELTSLAQDVINDSNAAVTAPDKGSESWTRWHPSKLCRKNVGNCMSSSAFATPIRDGQNLHDLSINSFTGVCQPEELAVFDRNKVELTRLKLLDLDSELQQFKMVNKMRTRPAGINGREEMLRSLSEDARSAQDHYLVPQDRLQRERDSIREQLRTAKLDLEDEKKRAQEREVQLEKLRDALRHQDQAQLVQMELLAASIDCEKQKGVTQLAEQHGKAAAFNQRVKMLLSTLNQKDEESQHMCCSKRVHEIELLRNKSADERAVTKMVMREKDETATQLTEQQRLFESLQA